MPKLTQVSFAAGELSPSLYARSDLARFQTGLRLCRNFVVRPTGGVSNRAGTRFVAETKDSSRESVLIPFVYSTEQAYMLEFGHQYIRVYANGSQVGSDVVTTYEEEDLAQIRFTQSADVMTLTHPLYPQAEFRRTAATTFTISDIVFENGPFLPENSTATTVQASAATGSVTLTASTGIFTPNHVGGLFKLQEDDLSGIPPWEPSKLLAANTANPDGELRRSNGKVYECVTNEVAGTDGTFTGSVAPSHEEGVESDGDGNEIATVATRAGVEWRYVHSGFGILRITAYTSATQVTADVIAELPASVVSGATEAWAFGAWSEEEGYPSVATYFGDRLVFANSPGSPQTEWASQVGDYHNFGISSPLVDSDAIAQTLNARQVNAIRELIPLDQLIALTSNSGWASPKRGAAWTPETIGFDPQSYDGSANQRSVIVGDTALYVENNRTKVRDLRYTFEVDKFSGSELTVLARHLFSSTNTILDMDYAREPHGILWLVRADGSLAALTYLREQDVIGWHWHDTQGGFERVCVIPEDGVDVPYVIVKRTVDGDTKRYIERFAPRDVEELADHVLMDSALSYDGRVTDGTTLSLTLASGDWTVGSEISLTASSGLFTGAGPDEVRARITTTDEDGEDSTVEVAIRITHLTSSTVVEGEALCDIPVAFQASALTDWGVCYDTFSGIDHLEGCEVVGLADGSAVRDLVVSAGAVTLQSPAERFHVGLGYRAQIETLDMNWQGGPVIRDRQKTIPSASVVVQDTVGLSIGLTEDTLEQIPWRELENYDEATGMFSGAREVAMMSGWDAEARLVIRQDDPLPCTVLAVIPEIRLGAA